MAEGNGPPQERPAPQGLGQRMARGAQSALNKIGSTMNPPWWPGDRPGPQNAQEYTQAVGDRAQTLGFTPNIDWTQMAQALGPVLTEAVAAGIKDAQKSLPRTTTSRAPVSRDGPDLPDIPGLNPAAQKALRAHQQRGSFPGSGIDALLKGLALTVGVNWMKGSTPGGGAFGTPGPAEPTGSVPQPAPASEPGSQPLPASTPPTPTTPTPQPPGEPPGGGTEPPVPPPPVEPPLPPPPPPNEPPPPEGGEEGGNEPGAENAAADQAATETAAGGSAFKRIMGAGLVGYGAQGLRGAWSSLSAASPGLASVLGPIGWGVTGLTAIDAGLNQLAAQRQMGAFYQSILGGTNIGGQEQRLQQGLFRFSQLGNLSGAQASALFQGTTALDMTGEQRANAMQTAVQLYDQLGVSIQSSLQNITIAAQSGNKELNNLASSIQNVTNAAQVGQVNANVARQNFTNMYAATTGVIQGSNAAAVASGLTSAQTHLGQIAQGVNQAGLVSQQTLNLVASHYGLTEAQLTGGIESGRYNYGAMLGGMMTSGAGPINQAGQDVTAAVKALGYQNAYARNAQTAGMNTDVQRWIQQNAPDATSLNYGLIDYYQQVYGLSLNQSQAWAYAMGARLPGGVGSFNAGAGENAASVNPRTRRFGTAAQAAAVAGGYENPTVTWFDPTVPKKVTAAYKAAVAASGPTSGGGGILGEFFGKGTGTGWLADLLGAGKSPAEVASSWYRQNYLNKGKENQAMQQILGDPTVNNAQTLFHVDTTQGQRTVGVEDLEKYFMPQVAAGTARFATGTNAGRAISDVYSFQQGNVQLANTKGIPQSVLGQAEQNKLNRQVAKAEKNVLTVVPSPLLQQWMQFQSNSPNISVDSQTATNMPATSYPDKPPVLSTSQ